MTSLFYSDPFARQTPFGTGRYARELYLAMMEMDPTMRIKPVSAWTDRDASGIRELQRKFGYQKLPWNRKVIGSAWAFLKAPPIEHWVREPFDLVHMLEVTYPVPTRKPLVATVHDIMPLTHPEFLTNARPWLVKIGLRHVIAKADAIICVSQKTADELTGYFKVDLGDRLKVVHEGVAPRFSSKPASGSLRAIPGLPPDDVPVIMTTGAVSARKNMVRVVEALERLEDRIPHHLVHVGNPAWDSNAFVEKVKRSPIADRIHLPGYLTDEQLHALYWRASAYVYVSLLEGFGLPLLEAMAAGLPVVTSSISSMPEIAGEAAIQVDPFSVDGIADGILEVCTDQSTAARLRERGRTRAAEFSWEKCARETHAIYKAILD